MKPFKDSSANFIQDLFLISLASDSPKNSLKIIAVRINMIKLLYRLIQQFIHSFLQGFIQKFNQALLFLGIYLGSTVEISPKLSFGDYFFNFSRIPFFLKFLQRLFLQFLQRFSQQFLYEFLQAFLQKLLQRFFFCNSSRDSLRNSYRGFSNDFNGDSFRNSSWNSLRSFGKKNNTLIIFTGISLGVPPWIPL